MPPPKRGEPGYAEYREQYNERRRKRLEDPEHRARYSARMIAKRLDARQKIKMARAKPMVLDFSRCADYGHRVMFNALPHPIEVSRADDVHHRHRRTT
jgi:hypothetical protein